MCINNYLQSFRTWLSKGSRANWCLFVLFAMVLFIQNCMCHYFCHHSILVSSLWKAPLYFWSFYLPKISIALLLASCVFFIKRKWWIIVISVLLDVWFLTSVIYARIYEQVVDVYVILMAGNLRGFMSSILAIIEWKDSLFLLLTAILVGVIVIMNANQQNVKVGICTLAVSIVVWMASVNLNWIRYEIFAKHDNFSYIAPIHCFLHPLDRSTRLMIAGTAPHYDYSYLHLLVFDVYDLVTISFQKAETPDFSEQDLATIHSLIGSEKMKMGNDYLILVVFESLEDWVVRPEFTPNIYRLINSNHSLRAHKISKETMCGGSADGQMIMNTGMLPISNDAVCFRYPFNVFPHYPKNRSVTLLPHPIDVWNQTCMSPAYGYDTTVVSSEELHFQNAASYIEKGYDMMQIITLTSHEPFGGTSDLSFSTEMPELMAAYIKSVNCTDRYIGEMIDSLESMGLLDSVTIAISGDHTIFHKERRDRFAQYCQKKGLDYGVENSYCPLVVYSPRLTENVEIFDVAYQMDIFPTVIDILGYRDYYWKGFGVNLLDSAARHNRPITEQEAYRLSDLMIRSNYFEQYKP